MKRFETIWRVVKQLKILQSISCEDRPCESFHAENLKELLSWPLGARDMTGRGASVRVPTAKAQIYFAPKLIVIGYYRQYLGISLGTA